MAEHVLIGDDGVTRFTLGPVSNVLYEALLEEPYRLVPVAEVAERAFIPARRVPNYMGNLRKMLNAAGLHDVVFSRHGGWSLRRRRLPALR